MARITVGSTAGRRPILSSKPILPRTSPTPVHSGAIHLVSSSLPAAYVSPAPSLMPAITTPGSGGSSFSALPARQPTSAAIPAIHLPNPAGGKPAMSKAVELTATSEGKQGVVKAGVTKTGKGSRAKQPSAPNSTVGCPSASAV